MAYKPFFDSVSRQIVYMRRAQATRRHIRGEFFQMRKNYRGCPSPLILYIAVVVVVGLTNALPPPNHNEC